VVTDREDIASFSEALSRTTKLRFNPFPHHMEGLYSDPVYTLKIAYKNGQTQLITTQEGGQSIYRRLNSVTDHGDRGYISARNETLREWVEAIGIKTLRF